MIFKIITSNGDILDKFSILSIKKRKIKNKKQLKNINKEYKELKQIKQKICSTAIITKLYKQLIKINNTIWNIEDKIRLCEKNKKFDQTFINLARSVYVNNDIRAMIKKEINIKSSSHFIEEKSYELYD